MHAYGVGMCWGSFGFDWSVAATIVLARDAAFPALADFSTPFFEFNQ